MPEPSLVCASVRRVLLDQAVSGSLGEQAGATGGIGQHLEACPACRRYSDGLLMAPRLLHREPLYTSDLRVRTMARLEEASMQRTPRYVPPLVASLALAGMAFMVVPVWLLSEGLGLLLGSTTASTVLAVVLAHSLAGAAAGLCGMPVAAKARARGLTSRPFAGGAS